MPSPRAVLSDIHDLGLDPTVSHRNIKASGRLATKKIDEVTTIPEEVVIAPVVISVAIKSSSKTSATPKNALVTSAKIIETSSLEEEATPSSFKSKQDVAIDD